jgi:hypothetical protein
MGRACLAKFWRAEKFSLAATSPWFPSTEGGVFVEGGDLGFEDELVGEHLGPGAGQEVIEPCGGADEPAASGRAQDDLERQRRDPLTDDAEAGAFDLAAEGRAREEMDVGLVEDAAWTVLEATDQQRQAVEPERDVGGGNDEPAAFLEVAAYAAQQHRSLDHVLDHVGHHDSIEDPAEGDLERLLQIALEVLLQLVHQPVPGATVDAQHANAPGLERARQQPLGAAEVEHEGVRRDRLDDLGVRSGRAQLERVVDALVHEVAPATGHVELVQSIAERAATTAQEAGDAVGDARVLAPCGRDRHLARGRPEGPVLDQQLHVEGMVVRVELERNQPQRIGRVHTKARGVVTQPQAEDAIGDTRDQRARRSLHPGPALRLAAAARGHHQRRVLLPGSGQQLLQQLRGIGPVPAHHHQAVEAAPQRVLESGFARTAGAGVPRRAVQHRRSLPRSQGLESLELLRVGPIEHDHDLLDALLDAIGQPVQGALERRGIERVEEQQSDARHGPHLPLGEWSRIVPLGVIAERAPMYTRFDYIRRG